jgi:hypothetical protein
MLNEFERQLMTTCALSILRKLNQQMAPLELDTFAAALESARLRFFRDITASVPPRPMLRKLGTTINQASRLRKTLDDADLVFRLCRPFPIAEAEGEPPTWRGLVAGLDLLIASAQAHASRLDSHDNADGARPGFPDQPMKALVGTDLVRLAKDHLGLSDGFSRNASGPHGAIIDFVVAALDTLCLPALKPETIAKYISEGRSASR